MASVPGVIARRNGINGPDNAGFQVSADEWNAPLVVASGAPDGSLLVRDRTQPDGWGLMSEISPIVGVPPTRKVNDHPLLTDVWVTQADVGLGSVENIKLSTWGGSEAIATVGTITTGTWHGAIIQPPYGGTGSPYVQFIGPTSLHTYTLPDQNAILLTSVDVIPPAQGGTGVTTGLTQLNASNLTSGIVPDARLAGNVGRTNVANNILWMAVNKAGSSLADLEVRSASDLNTGTLPIARLPPEVVLGPLTAAGLPYHHTTHERNGADPIKLDDLALPDDNADLDATTTAHGLLPRLFGSPLLFLNSLGQWAIPAGGGGAGGGGDVVGPPSATPDAITLFSGATGKTLKNSGLLLSQFARVDQGNTFTGNNTVTGNLSVSGTMTATGGLSTTPLNASNLTSGFVPLARLPATMPPSAHASSHQPGGADVLTLSSGTRLFGRGAGAAGAMQEIALGAGLTMTGTTLAAVGGVGGLGDVVGPASAVVNRIAMFASTTGKVIADSGKALADLGNVYGPASAVTGRIAIFADATGKLLADSGVASGNFAFLDQANVFTQNQTIASASPAFVLRDTSAPADARNWVIVNTVQTLQIYPTTDAFAVQSTPLKLARTGDVTVSGNMLITKVRPELTLLTPGDTTKARVFSAVPGGRMDLSTNMYYSGTDWMRDDPTKGAGLVTLFENGQFGVWSVAAGGTNPIGAALQARFVVDKDGIGAFYKAARPELQLIMTGAVAKARLFSAVANDVRISRNVMYDGAAFNLDDTAASGAELELSAGGNFAYGVFDAGANPRTMTPRLVIGSNGDTTHTCNELRVVGNPFSRLHLRDTSVAAGGQTFVLLSYTQKLYFCPALDDGTLWQSGASSWDAGMTLDRSGNLTTNGNITGRDVYSTTPMYPGRLDTGWTKQASWYLASHGSYGLYINTGLYVAGNVWCGGAVIPALGIRPRTYSVGDTTAISPHCDQYDLYCANGISSSITIQNGYCNVDGWPMTLRLRDNGAARPIYWDTLYMSACGVPLPSQTGGPGGVTGARVMHIGIRFSTHYGKWLMVACTIEP